MWYWCLRIPKDWEGWCQERLGSSFCLWLAAVGIKRGQSLLRIVCNVYIYTAKVDVYIQALSKMYVQFYKFYLHPDHIVERG